jgi:hypothetical protein
MVLRHGCLFIGVPKAGKLAQTYGSFHCGMDPKHSQYSRHTLKSFLSVCAFGSEGRSLFDAFSQGEIPEKGTPEMD